MAKNKAKMNKFVTGVATAAMVATAVVPVAAAAGFTDTDNLGDQVKVEVNKAVELGFFKDGGKFNPATQINRGQAALTLARYISGAKDTAGLKAYVEAKGLESSVVAFKDVPASFKDGEAYQVENYYASLIVKNAGAFTQENLNATGKMTRSQMAKVITETFKLEKAANYESKITDVNHLDAATKGYIETLASNEVTNVTTFNPAGHVTRSQMASFLVRSYDAVNAVVSDVKVESVTAITATTVTVAITAPTEDVVDADVVVKNIGGQTYAVNPVTIKAGATTATFTFTNPLTVTPTAGWTVNGVAYAPATFEIVNVESLTATGKHLEVQFNKVLTSLDASELNIRETDTSKRLGVEKVSLASDGLSATVTLLGDESNSSAAFAAALVDYTLSITQNGKVTSTVFNLDQVVANVVVRNTDAKEGTLNGRKLVKDLTVDFEDVLGRTVTYWFNKDGFITRVNVADEVVKFDAIEFETKTDGNLYINTLTEDKSYRIANTTNFSGVARTNQVVTKVVGGNSDASLGTLTTGTFASAKLVFDKQGNVNGLVVIPTFTSQILVEKTANETIVQGHGDELNLKDYTLIKQGKTIKVADIKAGDVLYYNSSTKVAEVYNNTITKEISAVFNGEFKVGDKVYSINGAQTIDEDGKLKALDQDTIEALEAGKKPVILSFDREGNLVFVTGEQGELVTAKNTSYLTAVANSYDYKGAKHVSLKVQDAKGTKATEEFDSAKLKSVTINGVTIKVGDISGSDTYTGFTVDNAGLNTATLEIKKSDTASGNANGTTSNYLTLSSLGKGDVVDVVKDTDGVVVGLNITRKGTLSGAVTMPAKALPVTTHGNLQVVSSTPVFIENTDKTITSTTWGALDADITRINTTNVDVYAKYNKNGSITDVDYLVIPFASIVGAVEADDKEAVVADVRYNTDSEVAYLKLAINGEIKEYELSLTGSNKNFSAVVGDVVKASINKKSGKVQTLAASEGDNPFGILATSTVKVGAGEFDLAGNTYTRATTGIQVYEITGTGSNKTVEVRSFSDLANLKPNNAIKVSTVATGSKYADTVVITTNADGAAPVAPGAPTGIAFTDTNSDGIINATELASLKLGFTAANGSTVAVAITDGTTTLNYSTNGTGAAQTIDVSAGVGTLLQNTNITATVTSSNNAGTASATSSTVQVDKTAPTATKTTDTATSLGLTMSETSTVAITSAALLAGGETVSATGTAGTTETFTVTTGGAVTGDTFEFTITDVAGNVSTYDATFTTTWAVVLQP